ncbi:hypothetical protein ACW9HC_34480, partial [Nocardia gipuzkoensis]
GRIRCHLHTSMTGSHSPWTDHRGPVTHVSDISTHAAAASHHVMQLILRGLTQTGDADQRSALLNTLDDLLRLGAFGIDEMVSAHERT